MIAPAIAGLPDPAWQDDDPAPIHPLLAEWGAALRAELESEPMPEWTAADLMGGGSDD